MRLALTLFAALALAGCSDSTPAESESADDFAARTGVAGEAGQGAVPSVAEVNAQPVAPSEGEVALTPLTRNARTALGPTSGGCAFAYQGRTLLSVGAPDDMGQKGKGVLVANGRQMVLGGIEAGGPQVVESGPTLTGGAWTASVLRAEGSPAIVGGGGNQWPADLVVKGPQGETKFSPGTWTCSR